LTERRRMLKTVDPVVFEGELFDATSKMQHEGLDLQNQRKHEVTMKVLDSLPDAIGIAKDIVSIWKIKAETDRDVQLIDKEIDKLRAQTEDFVKREIAKRDTSVSRAEKVQNMLRDLYSGISNIEASDEIKKKLIDTFDSVVKVAIEEK
jgi:hypothetical protein